MKSFTGKSKILTHGNTSLLLYCFLINGLLSGDFVGRTDDGIFYVIEIGNECETLPKILKKKIVTVFTLNNLRVQLNTTKKKKKSSTFLFRHICNVNKYYIHLDKSFVFTCNEIVVV